MKAARQVVSHLVTKIVPSAKFPTSSPTKKKTAPRPLDTEQLQQVVGGALPKGGW